MLIIRTFHILKRDTSGRKNLLQLKLRGLKLLMIFGEWCGRRNVETS